MAHLIDHSPAAPVNTGWEPPAPPPPQPPRTRRRWPIKKIIAGFAILLVGVGIGSAGSGSDAAAKKEIANLRAAKDSAEATLVDTRIQAAKDVNAAEAKPPRVVTQTVTKEVAPPACLRAVDIAEQINDISADQAGRLRDYFDTVSTLADSGDTLSFLQGMSTATQRLTSQTKTNTGKVEALISSWQAARDGCRAAG